MRPVAGRHCTPRAVFARRIAIQRCEEETLYHRTLFSSPRKPCYLTSHERGKKKRHSARDRASSQYRRRAQLVLHPTDCHESFAEASQTAQCRIPLARVAKKIFWLRSS